MQPNPFDDPEVQAAAVSAAAPVGASVASDPAVQSAVWDATSNAYSTGSDPKSSIASDPKVQSAVGAAVIGHFTGSNKAPPPPPAASQPAVADNDNAYGNGWDPEANSNQSTWDSEANQPKSAPEEKTFFGAAVACCGGFSARVPLRYCLIILGILLVFAGIFDFATNFNSPLDLFVNFYLIGFGVVSVFIEFPRMRWNAMVQEGILYWAYFLARLWGRALLYVFLAILCVSDSKSPAKIAIGVYCFILVFIMYFVSYQAAQKLKRINTFVTQGTEGEQRLELIARKYKEVAKGMDHIGTEAIGLVAEQASRELSFSEREAISRFFNPNFEDDITLTEWMEGFETIHKGIRLL